MSHCCFDAFIAHMAVMVMAVMADLLFVAEEAEQLLSAPASDSQEPGIQMPDDPSCFEVV